MKKFFSCYDKVLLIFFLFFVFLGYSLIAVSSHYQYQTFAWDLGFFDQLIWKISRFIYPLSSLNEVNILANHFSPILVFLAPLYWIYSSPVMLLIAQTFIMVSAAYPLYLLAIKKTQSFIFSLAVVFSYLFFLGTQWSILNEFHEATFAPLFIVLIFYALETNFNKALFIIGSVGLLITKEIFSLLLASIGLTIMLYYKQKKLGAFIFFFSLFFFFFLTSFFMPKISEKGVYQHEHLSTEAKSPGEFVLKSIHNPMFVVKSLISPPEKIKTFFVSFLSFGLIPIFAPFSILIPVFTQFLLRFLYTGPQYTAWLNVNHHAASAAILLPIAAIYSACRITLKNKKNKKKFLILAGLLFFSTFVQDVVLKAPIHSLFKKQLYERQQWMRDNDEIVKIAQKIDKKIPIATQNSLFPHLSQRENIYLLPKIKDASYIVLDLREGPNKFAPMSHLQMKDFVQNLLTTKKYSIIYQQGEAMLLRKIEQ